MEARLLTPRQTISLLHDYAEVARWQIVPCSDSIRRQVEASPNITIDPEIAEFARNRPADTDWVWWPLGRRLGLVAFGVESVIAWLERDCTGWTRSNLLKSPK